MPKIAPKLFGIYPEGPGGYHRMWLYLVGLEDGQLKVGMTSRPRARMRNHRLGFGKKLAWTHLFPGSSWAVANQAERHAIREFAKLGMRRGRTEMFTGVSREQALPIAREGLRFARQFQAMLADSDDARPGDWKKAVRELRASTPGVKA